MVYKFKPLELSIDFDNRGYKLGDTIDIEVAITPTGELNVREGRVELLCEEIHARADRGIAMGAGGSATVQGGNPHTGTDYIPMSSSVSQRSESYVHSSVVFLKDATLGPGTPSTYGARLQIQPQPPKHFDEAKAAERDANSSWTFKWTLVATIDVVRGRNPKRQRKVDVVLDAAPTGQRLINKPRMTRPKGSTGPSA